MATSGIKINVMTEITLKVLQFTGSSNACRAAKGFCVSGKSASLVKTEIRSHGVSQVLAASKVSQQTMTHWKRPGVLDHNTAPEWLAILPPFLHH